MLSSLSESKTIEFLSSFSYFLYPSVSWRSGNESGPIARTIRFWGDPTGRENKRECGLVRLLRYPKIIQLSNSDVVDFMTDYNQSELI